ncbi:MAG: cation:proton antiporter [Pseudomonadota bacterium]|jgi:CPA2 family monovalent cation:H+ antiporter-2|nr:cation:proton antiporter [Alphaproteobacteria bacterium]
MHGEFGITNIALVILIALIFGLGMTRLKQPPILGYIIAGLILGPSGLAYVESRDQVSILAEMGVLLLLFVIGIELNLRTFKKVWLVTSLATLFQIVICTGVTWAISYFLGWGSGLPVLLGFITAISSTAVAVKMLDTIGETNSEIGQISIGILIAQDFAIVPMILILRNYHADLSILGLFSKLLLAVGIIAGLIYYLSQKQRVRIGFLADVIRQKDLLPLVSLVFCFAAAALSGVIGLSAAYGAFLAGLTIGNTHERSAVLDTVKPIQSTLIMVFFLSIGILMDVGFIYLHLGTFILLLLLITVGKTAINILILRFLQIPWSEAFLVGVVLAQIGEFAFLMASIGHEAKIIDEFGEKLILSLTALSLLFSPIWMTLARHLKNITDDSKISIKDVVAWLTLPGSHFLKFVWKRAAKEWKEEEKSIKHPSDDA